MEIFYSSFLYLQTLICSPIRHYSFFIIGLSNLSLTNNQNKKMQITITNASGASTAYAVESTTTVESLKSMIENKEFIPSNLIRLVNGASDLEGGTLVGNGVQDEDELNLLLDVSGGMRKKWKKKRMRRLRRKRRKMRQRAR